MERLGLDIQGLEVRLPGASGSTLSGINVQVDAGARLVLVGESGAGKTTLLNVLSGAVTPSAGTVTFDGVSPFATAGALRGHRRGLGIVLQSPVGSLDPRQRCVDAVAEPLVVRSQTPKNEALERAFEELEALGLSADEACRLPGALSGGQCQRVAVARALIGRPRWVLADEPTASLDPHVGGELWVAFLERLSESASGLVLATHDLLSPALNGATVLVLRGGLCVETVQRFESMEDFHHPYSRELVEAIR